jgi:hypothetical protein
MKKIGLMSAVLMSGAAFAADGIKLGGFAEAGFAWTKTGSADADKGFYVNEGALYFGKTVGMGEVYVDLAFKQSGGAPFSTEMALAQADSQAYITWKYENGFQWKLGQFDNFQGYESNDSVANFFSIPTAAALAAPTVFNGALIGYKASDALTVSFLYSNPGNKQGINSVAKADMGALVEMASDAYKINASYIMSGSGAAHDGDYGMNLNVVASSKMGMLDTAVEFDMTKDGAAGAKSNMGFGGHFGYEMSETLALGAAVEWAKNGTTDASILGLRVGPKWAMNKDFNLRVGFGYSKESDATDAKMSFGVNAVHSF